MPEPRSVVVRLHPALRLVGGPAAAFVAFGCWWAVVASVVHHDAGWPFRDSGLSPTGEQAGWVITAIVLVATTAATAVVVGFRQEYDAAGVTVRRLLRSRRLDLVDMGSIRTVAGSVHTGSSVVRFPRLLFTARDPRGPRAALDQGMSGFAPALEVVRGWVAQWPSLVADDATRALFAPDASP